MTVDSKEIGKCPFFDTGYCKYGDKCQYQHYKTKCQNKDCANKACTFRHPKPCKYKESCRRFAKANCAYDHENQVNQDSLKDKIKHLDDKMKENEKETNIKLKKCLDEAQTLYKSREEMAKQNIMLERTNKDQEKRLIEEVTRLNARIDKIIQSHENEIKNVKKENKNLKMEVEILKTKFIEKVVKEKIDSLDDTTKQITKNLKNTTIEIVSNEAEKESDVLDKSKVKKKKVTKDEIQQNIINEFKEDCKSILGDRVGSGHTRLKTIS